jgi:hypothetical protein
MTTCITRCLALFCWAMAHAPLLHAQSGFPALEGSTVEGEVVRLPRKEAGRYTIVAMAYGKKAEPLLEEWYRPAYSRFVAKNGLFAGSYEVDLYLVPLFTGLDKAAYGPSMERLRQEADPEVARRVVFFHGDAKALIQDLGMSNKDIPYFFVLNAEGRIVQRVSGAFTVDKLEALEAPMLE